MEGTHRSRVLFGGPSSVGISKYLTVNCLRCMGQRTISVPQFGIDGGLRRELMRVISTCQLVDHSVGGCAVNKNNLSLCAINTYDVGSALRRVVTVTRKTL